MAKELQDGFRKDGLWLRAATESEDVEQKARRLYVRYWVQEIKDELDLEAQREAATASQGVRQRYGGSAQSPEPLESDAGPRSVGCCSYGFSLHFLSLSSSFKSACRRCLTDSERVFESHSTEAAAFVEEKGGRWDSYDSFPNFFRAMWRVLRLLAPALPTLRSRYQKSIARCWSSISLRLGLKPHYL